MSGNNGTPMDPVTKMLVGQESMRGDIRELSATVRAHMEKVGREVEVLFADRKEHGKAISHIRETYVTKDDFRQFEKVQRQDFAAMKAMSDSTRTRVTVIVTVASVAVTALTLYSRFMP